MTDKERIMMAIILWTIPGLLYRFNDDTKGECVKFEMFSGPGLQQGDLVMAATTRHPHDFAVGFVHEVREDCVVIRELGTKRLCNYYNEGFLVINKERLGYEILEGTQYKTYKKTLKAFTKYAKYGVRFQNITFSGNVCTVTSRNMFSNEKYKEASFCYNSKTRISDIGRVIEEYFNEEVVK